GDADAAADVVEDGRGSGCEVLVRRFVTLDAAELAQQEGAAAGVGLVGIEAFVAGDDRMRRRRPGRAHGRDEQRGYEEEAERSRHCTGSLNAGSEKAEGKTGVRWELTESV